MKAENTIEVKGKVYALTRLGNAGVNLAYRGVSTSDREVIFVKRTSDVAAKNLAAVCGVAEKLGIAEVPRLIGVVKDGEATKICVEWREGRQIEIEDMNDGQFDAYCKICDKVGKLLDQLDVAVRSRENEPHELYEVLREYRTRHPIAGGWLNGFLAIPEAERSLRNRALSVIHNDFHSGNYSFDGDGIVGVYDFDSIATGMPCEDVLRSFLYTFRKAHLSRSKRNAALRRLRQAMGAFPWPKSDWETAINVWRIFIARGQLPPFKKWKWYKPLEIWWKDRLFRAILSQVRRWQSP